MTAGPAQGRSFSAIDLNRKRACPPQDAGTIEHLHNTLRALPRPLLESLTRAFRKRFQVPDTAVTIADRISQKSHHDWIEAFLVSHREVRSANSTGRCALQNSTRAAAAEPPRIGDWMRPAPA